MGLAASQRLCAASASFSEPRKNPEAIIELQEAHNESDVALVGNLSNDNWGPPLVY